VFIHGLGGTTESFIPLIHRLALHKKYNCHLFDLEGHGLSPTHPLSVLSIASFASDLAALFHHTGITHGATLIAYSPLGCAIATKFAVTHAGLAARLILVNPAAAPLKFFSTEALKEQLHALADTARTQGMSSVAGLNGDMHDWENYSAALANDEYDPIALAARRLSLLSQDPEGYAKACSALADSLDEKPSYDRVEAQIVIVDGRNPPIFTNSTDLGHVAVKNIEYKHVSSWYGFENVREVAQAVEEGLKETEECIL
jgi:pimeloyl-ACP methyl ester carboxylesterase